MKKVHNIVVYYRSMAYGGPEEGGWYYPEYQVYNIYTPKTRRFSETLASIRKDVEDDPKFMVSVEYCNPLKAGKLSRLPKPIYC